MSTRLDNWMFASYPLSATSLGIFRIVFATILLVGTQPQLAWISSYPSSLFAPPVGPFLPLPGIPPELSIFALIAALNISLVALAFGYRTRAASFATAGLLFVGYGISYSFGAIDHNFSLVLAPLLFGLSNWGERFSVDRILGRVKDDGPRWPLMLFMLLIGLMMFGAGVGKLIGGWLDPGTQATQGYVIQLLFRRPEGNPFAEWLLGRSDGLFEVLDYATVVFEIGFLPAVLIPRLARIFLAVAVLFHLLVFLALGISFVDNVISYGGFVAFDRLARLRAVERCRIAARPLGDSVRRDLAPWAGPITLGIGLLAAAVSGTGGPIVPLALDKLGIDGQRAVEGLLFVVAAGISLVFLGWEVVRLARPRLHNTQPAITRTP